MVSSKENVKSYNESGETNATFIIKTFNSISATNMFGADVADQNQVVIILRRTISPLVFRE
ncbi:spore germination protein [Bacillus mycoides]|uniref:spore germination protein n=1 Tax=Bacillus mycoides TaxID=1405 RepID=UPI003670BD76